ncbi:hypothetical protein evm_012170 [Chilo suppressalis]|nr:hypothetical protein evm_012170 [Chilo suppressalis]
MCNQDISRHILNLEGVLDHLADKPVLICVDSNTHSPMWFCEERQYTGRGRDTEYRRNHMDGFILSRNLRIHNEPDQSNTFSGVLTEKVVDLQQKAVNKSKILSKNKLTPSAMDQSVTNLIKSVEEAK